MQASWIDPSDLLLGRLDGEFYAPEFVQHERLVASKRSDPRLGLRSLGLVGKLITGPFGSKLPSNLYQSDGVPLFRVQNVQPFFADESNLVYIAPEVHRELRSSEIKHGGVLISKAGRVGDACIAPAHFDRINITEHVIGLTTNRDVDAYYLTAALNADFAGIQLKRFGLGTILQYLGVADTRSVEVPVPDPNLQSAIGNKLRKAERLRELCDDYWVSAKARFEALSNLSLDRSVFEEVGQDQVNDPTYYCVSTAPPSSWVDVGAELAAQYYHPRRVHSQKLAMATGNWQPLKELANLQRIRDHESPSRILVGLDQIDSRLGVLARGGNGAEQEQPSGVVYRDRCILFSRLRPYLNKVAIWPEHWTEGTGSGELLVYEAKQCIDAHYLFFLLKSPLGLYQVLDVTAGSTLPRVEADVVEDIRIPRLTEDQEEAIGSLVRSAHKCWYETEDLISTANAAVEELIEGTLDEGALLAQGNEIERWLQNNPVMPSNGAR